MIRVLGAVRLSRLTDASTSPARQRERIEYWSAGNDGEIIGIAEDLDVSGAVSPFDRPDLGDWLTEDQAPKWDVIVAWKLDRLSRSAIDTLKLLEWCDAHGKRIVCVDDGIDSATHMGQVWIQLAGIFAQVERNFIKERAIGSRQKLRSEGRWHGEAVMHGIQPVKLKGGGYRLEIDPEASLVVGWIIDEVLKGASVESVAAELTNNGILPPRQYRRWQTGKPHTVLPWQPQTVRKILTSKALLGHMTYEDETFYDAEGTPILKAPPLLLREDFDRLQAVIEGRKKPKATNRTRNASMLIGVAFCAKCDAKMHHRGQTMGDKLYRYYYCSERCGQNSVRAEWVEESAETAFLNLIGDKVVLEPVFVPGEDHTAELTEAQSAYTELITRVGKTSSRSAADALAAQLDALERRMTELEQLPNRPATVDYVPTSRTYHEEWESRDDNGRRKLMTEAGVKILVKPGDFRIEADTEIVGSSIDVTGLPEEIAQKLADAKAGKPTDWGGKRYKTLD